MASKTLHLSWNNPVQVTFGLGVLAQIPRDLPIAVLADARAVSADDKARIQARLGAQCRVWLSIDIQQATPAYIYQLAQQLWPHLTESAMPLLAIGGGSLMDIAKVLRFCPQEAVTINRLTQHWLASDVPPSAVRHPLWLAPTTAGTGSEVTASATLWDIDNPDGARKYAWVPNNGFADKAWIDPNLTLSCPVSITRDCGLDALAHALESIWNHHASPLTTALAVQAAKRILESLPALLRALSHSQSAPDILLLRQQMALASWQAGLAMSQTRTALAHALSYELTLAEGLPHGQACAVWLPMAWRMAMGYSTDCDAALTQIFGAQGAVALTQWLEQLDITPRQASAQLVAQALLSVRGRNFIATPIH